MSLTIAVSACLLGTACRFDGQAKPCEAALRLAELPGVTVVPICPEEAGGLPTPRTASEIVGAGEGRRVIDRAGTDRTPAFELGAQKTLELVGSSGCALAMLKAKSPSCGIGRIYDGSFTGALVPGNGIAAQLLIDHGITVIDERELGELEALRNTPEDSEALAKALENRQQRTMG